MGSGGRNITTRYHGVYATFIIVLIRPRRRGSAFLSALEEDESVSASSADRKAEHA